MSCNINNESITVEIICPVYNAEQCIEKLHQSLINQKDVSINKISYLLTESIDNTEKVLEEISKDYIKIRKEGFSHSLSRETAAMNSEADILVFITQDIVVTDANWMKELINPLITGETHASFSRQLTKFNNIEKYTREKNYPDKSYIVSKEDVDKMGLRAFFFSDASSAIKTDIFKKLKGYDNKKLPISEDMYIAYKLIMNGYKIKYCADSIVYHSHKFTLKQLYKRYYDTGVFFKQNIYLNKYDTNKAGSGMARFIFRRAIQDKNIKVLIEFIPNICARFLGMQIGKISASS